MRLSRQFQNEHTNRIAKSALISNVEYYGDKLPYLDERFSAAKTAQRTKIIINILLRAARRAVREGNDGELLFRLAEKLQDCGPRFRCGSLACPMCARALQLAKTETTQRFLDEHLLFARGLLVFVTIIPTGMMYEPGEFAKLDVVEANQWLMAKLEHVGNRTIVGSIDLGWEKRRGGSYLQVHWHLMMWTTNPKALEAKLKNIFAPGRKWEQAVKVKVPDDTNFIAYQNKIIKLPSLLRTARRQLPELLIALDRTDPMDAAISQNVRFVAKDGLLALVR